MTEEEFIVEREVHIGEGAQKEKPKPQPEHKYQTRGEQELAETIEEFDAVKRVDDDSITTSPAEVVSKNNVSVDTQRTEVRQPLLDAVKTVAALLPEREEISQEKTLDDFLSSFDFIEEIGYGGISRVHLVRQRSTGAEFAYKQIDLEKLRAVVPFNPEAPNVMANLLRDEAKIINEVGAENPQSYPRFAIDWTYSSRPGFLTEYVPHSLEERIGKLNPQQAVRYFLQAADAVSHLHRRKNKIILADVKPSQFRIDNNGNVKLVDLNLKHSETEDSAPVSSIVNSMAMSLVSSSKVHGTLRYMTPEQLDRLEGKEAVIDERTDIFQVASLAYELLTGTKPEGSYEPLTGELEALNEVILKGRARNKDKRYATMEEFVNAVREKVGMKEKVSPLEKVLKDISESSLSEEHMDPVSYWTARANQTEKLLVEFYKAAKETLVGKRLVIADMMWLSRYHTIEFSEEKAQVSLNEFFYMNYHVNLIIKESSAIIEEPKKKDTRARKLSDLYLYFLQGKTAVSVIAKKDNALRSLPQAIMDSLKKGNYTFTEVKEKKKAEPPRGEAARAQESKLEGKVGDVETAGRAYLAQLQKDFNLPSLERYKAGVLPRNVMINLTKDYFAAALKTENPNAEFDYLTEQEFYIHIRLFKTRERKGGWFKKHILNEKARVSIATIGYTSSPQDRYIQVKTHDPVLDAAIEKAYNLIGKEFGINKILHELP